MATSDVTEVIITANHIKAKNLIVVKTNGGSGWQSRHDPVVYDDDLETEMETKYTDRFEDTSTLSI